MLAFWFMTDSDSVFFIFIFIFGNLFSNTRFTLTGGQYQNGFPPMGDGYVLHQHLHHRQAFR